MKRYSAEQAEQIACRFFQHHSARCPIDGADVRFESLPIQKTAAIELDFVCTLCGTRGGFIPEVASSDEKWTEAEIKVIIENYWHSHSPRCPRDSSILHCHKLNELGPPRLLISCPRCGRNLDSGEV